jgi:hypothetical protein
MVVKRTPDLPNKVPKRRMHRKPKVNTIALPSPVLGAQFP